ncbi:MAG: hypothetical protein QOD03_607 [Verrucomicrobiota bacterium]
MDADEKSICTYLKSWNSQFVSGREIARRAGGKKRFREDPNWAGPVLSRLVERNVIESDSTGHYRLFAKEKSNKPKKWVSPNIKKILEQSGKDFSHVIETDEDES